MYRKIYIHVFAIIKQPTYHISIRIVLKNETILTKIPCDGAALDLSGTMWYGSANHT